MSMHVIFCRNKLIENVNGIAHANVAAPLSPTLSRSPEYQERGNPFKSFYDNSSQFR